MSAISAALQPFQSYGLLPAFLDSPLGPSLPSGRTLDAGPHLLQRSDSSRVAIHTQAQAEFSLVTAEGDTVTISASSFARTNFTTYDFLGRSGDALVSRHSEDFRAQLESRFDISVIGDINEAELADILALLEDFEALADDFFSGSLEPSLATTLAADNFEHIAGFDASLTFSQRVHIIQRTQERVTQLGQNQHSQPESTSDTSPQRAQLSEDLFPTQTIYRPVITAESIDEFIETLLQKAEEVRVALSQVVEPSRLAEAAALNEETLSQLADLLNSILDQLAERQKFDPPKQNLATHVQAEFSQQLNFTFQQHDEVDVA